MTEECDNKVWLDSPFNYFVRCGFRHLEMDGGEVIKCDECTHSS